MSPSAPKELETTTPTAQRDERTPLLPLRATECEIAINMGEAMMKEADPVMYDEFLQLLDIVYPVVLTSALEFLPGFTCVVLTGHLQSPLVKEYLDAATLSTMFANITSYSIGFGLSSALDTLCSQAYGAKRYERIGVYFQSGLVVVGAWLLPIFLVNWFSGAVLVALGQDPQVAALAQVYSRYMLLGMPFLFLYEMVRKVLQAQNIMRPLVIIAVIGNIVNLVSGYVLGYHTSMGFAGIALSRSLGNMVLPLLLIPYFAWKPVHLSQWWHGWNLRDAMSHVALFLRLGIPGMVMLVMEWWAYELLAFMAGLLPNGVLAVSAHAVLMNVVSMLFMIFLGFSIAGNIRVGNCLGANEPKRAKLVSELVLKLVLFIATLLTLGLFFLRESIPALLVNDKESIAMAAQAIVVWAPFEIIEALNCVTQGIFRGAGKQQLAAKTNAIAYYIVGIPIAALVALKWGWGINGLWLGFGAGLSVSLLTLLTILRRADWDQLAKDAQDRTAE